MTDTTVEYVSAAQAIVEACELNEPVHQMEPGKIYAVRQPGGGFTKLDLTGDDYRQLPQRKLGTVAVRDVASLAQYFAKHSDSGSEVFADLDAAAITAVLDAHLGTDDVPDAFAGEGARWQAHRAVLAMKQTPEWQDWAGKNKTQMSQQAFAEWIEDHAADIAPGGPATAADLLEMAQHFHAHTKVTYSSAKRLKDGQTQLTYSEETTASGGGKGTIEIPDAFELAIRPFEDSEMYRVKARFRYRLVGGDLRMFYHLNDPDRTFRDAVLQVVAKAEEACKVTIMRGRPA
jgi:uncharacterized protein YfdQ (DUF2303 family)